MSVHQPAIHEEPDGTKSYVCAICQHRFKRKDHLKKHVETVHEKTRAYACMLCEYMKNIFRDVQIRTGYTI